MNRPTLATVKTKIKTHTPEIITTTVMLIGVGAALYFATKSSTAPTTDKSYDGGPILVLEGRGDNIYTDLDYPGVMYEVNIVS